MTDTIDSTTEVRDRPLWLFHWSLASTVAGLFSTGWMGGLWLAWHKHLGVLALALIAFRIAWGFMGTAHSRLASLVPTRAELKNVFDPHRKALGHRLLGALSALLMLGAIGVQAGSGLFIEDDLTGTHGPLHGLLGTDRSLVLNAFHGQNTQLILALIALHLTAIAYYIGTRRMDVVRPMLSAKIKLSGQDIAHSAQVKKRPRVTAAFVAGAVVFFALEYETWSGWFNPLTTRTAPTTPSW